MKTFIISSIFIVIVMLETRQTAMAYQDSPKDQQCVDACNAIYAPQYLACHAVAQCEAFVQYQAGNCIHQCPNRK